MSKSVVLDLKHRRNNPRNSEGSFVTLKGGRILFVYTHYYGRSWQDEATARLCSRFSDDMGRTWSRRSRLVLENEGRCNVMSVSLLRLQDGRIAMWYLRKNGPEDCRLYMRTSKDEARSWSRAKLCMPYKAYYVVNNDRVIQLRSGRLVIPAMCKCRGLEGKRLTDPYWKKGPMAPLGMAMSFLSDDAGKSWRISRNWRVAPKRSKSGLQEPGVVELRNGSLYTYSRTDLGCQYEMRSRDGGETWTSARPSVFKAPCSPLSIKRIPETGDLLAVWNDHSGRLIRARSRGETEFGEGSSWGRTPLVSAISADEGRNWKHFRLIEKDRGRGFCYTAIHFADDAVLLAYCCGGRKSAVLQDLCIRRVSLNWLYG